MLASQIINTTCSVTIPVVVLLFQTLMEPPTQGEEYDDEGDAGEEAESTSAAAGGQTEVAGQQIEYEMLDESVAKQQQQETMEQD